MNSKDIRSSAGIFLGIGLALIVLGSLAIYSVVFATFASVIFFGWLLIFSGFIQTGHALYARHWNGFLLGLMLGLLSIVAGALILFDPAVGATALTLLLAFLFIAQGALRITMALVKRFEHWGWVLISGIFSLILGVMILYQWPYSGLYIIGLFVGIDLIFNGWALVMLSVAARKLRK
jgi:uncharacterized membrane protein HdeD (DUF308 family)